MRPPFDIVVRSPLSGVEIIAHTPSATFSRLPNGSRATTSPSDEAQSARAALGIADAASARCAAHEPQVARNSRRSIDTVYLPGICHGAGALSTGAMLTRVAPFHIEGTPRMNV